MRLIGTAAACAALWDAQILDSSNDVHNLNIVDRALLIGGKTLLQRCSDAQDSIALSAIAQPHRRCSSKPRPCSRTGLRRACRTTGARARVCLPVLSAHVRERGLPLACQCELLCVCVASSACECP